MVVPRRQCRSWHALQPDDESEPSDDIKLALFRLAAESVKAIGALAQANPKPALLWNEELDPATFLAELNYAVNPEMNDEYSSTEPAV